MTTPAVQTSAQVLVEYTGTLLHNGDARMRQDAGGHMHPVIVLDLVMPGPLQLPLHVEQAFPANDMHHAQAAAKHYRAGQVVTVWAPITSLRVAVTATNVHTHDNTPAAPAPQPYPEPAAAEQLDQPGLFTTS